ncbi:hypothetical protein [Fusobacterium sp.]|uniref:hypothetical protein n=1 Tax=Fusobacterium sp. TaxID=68766 RepID=UPI002E795679|nr:hypothetical protein [Fusobacterium sp.]MEE1475741.1 hypothetical protein [Fusobacterium sp.]
MEERNNISNDYILQIHKKNNQLEKLNYKDGYITSLELLEQINIFRKQDGNKTELRHDNLLQIIRDEFSEEIRDLKIQVSYYTKETGNGTIRSYPMYILTYDQGKQVLMRESKFVRKSVIKYIQALEEKNNFSEKDRLLLKLFSTNPLEVKESYQALLKLETEPLKEEITHQKKVITGLTKGMGEKDKRTIINQVVRHGNGQTVGERWNILYYEFEKVEHCNLKTRVQNYIKKTGKKISYIEYIEKKLNKVDSLFNIACKLFESDINEIIEQYKLIQ